MEENDLKFVEKIFLEKRIKLPIIGLHLSNKWLYKDFKIIDFKNLINKIQNKFKLPIVITYGEAEMELAKNLEGDLNLKEVFIIGGLFLKTWASLIKKCALFFTMDTGATHVASAVGIPVVCVYQDENYEKCRSQWYPWGVPHLNLKRSELLNINEKLWEEIKQLIKSQ
ncbi:MAG: hypothetical protein HYU63_06375 [Armatimonadetes bacterium]|nr:hypothetical protein [Armatimonadota bacterium]